MSRWKRKVPEQGDPTQWITTTKGEKVEVYSEAVFVEEFCDLTVAFIPV